MTQITDQTGVAAPLGPEAIPVLLAVADHLNGTSPDDVLEQYSLLICFGAEAYKLKDRSLGGGAQAIAKAAFAVAPERTEGITRRAYAGELLRLVADAGHDWPSGDNDPAIPRITGIPGPRKDPKPTVPTQPKTGGDR